MDQFNGQVQNSCKDSILEQLATFDLSTSVQVNVIFEDDEEQDLHTEILVKEEKPDIEEYSKQSNENTFCKSIVKEETNSLQTNLHSNYKFTSEQIQSVNNPSDAPLFNWDKNGTGTNQKSPSTDINNTEQCNYLQKLLLITNEVINNNTNICQSSSKKYDIERSRQQLIEYDSLQASGSNNVNHKRKLVEDTSFAPKYPKTDTGKTIASQHFTDKMAINNVLNPQNVNKSIEQLHNTDQTVINSLLYRHDIRNTTEQQENTDINSLIYSQNTNVQTNIQEQHNIFNNYVQEPQNFDSPNTNKTSSEMTCINNLLNSVSQHLIVILQAHRKYKEGCTIKNGNPTYLEKLKHHFLRIKYHLFNLSFCTVNSIILPQQENSLFINSFLKETQEIAATKNMPINVQYHLSPLFIELLNWTKHKSSEMDKIELASINAGKNNKDNQLLRKHLAEPTKPPIIQNANLIAPFAGRNNDVPKSVTCSSGPPAQKLSISVDQPLLQSNFENGVKNQAPVQTIAHYNVNGNYSPQHKLPSYEQSQSQINLKNLQYQRMMDQYAVSNNYYCQPNYNQQGSNFTTQQRTAPWLHNASGTTSYLSRPAEMQQVGSQVQPLPIRTNFDTQTPESSRSLSTDSGFMSPVNFNNSSEMIATEETNTSLPSPMITHVTSLNPQASYIPEGKCYVCENITRQMCVGCYCRYYCSHLCQRFDWDNHKTTCRPQT